MTAVFRPATPPGVAAVAVKGALRAHKWLLARRLSQVAIVMLFLTGGWIVTGGYASSTWFGVLPLTDPFLLLQGLAAAHPMATKALLGAAIVAVFYALAGRVYCAWVCPLNIVTDTAAWLRRRLGMPDEVSLPRATRWWLLGAVFALAAASGAMAWEWVNPVTLLQRGLVFGFGLAWLAVLGVFAFDLLAAPRAWCGRLCPMGAFYAALGAGALARVSARHASRCDQCLDCYRVCPEPQVITPALKGAGSPVIRSAACTNCGRCIDVCSQDVLRFVLRFDQRRD